MDKKIKDEWDRINKLWDDITELKSYRAFEDILDGIVLEDFQTADLMRSLFFRKFIFSYDTGLGKTLMACAWMKMLKRENPKRRFVMFVKKSQLAQTPRKIQQATGFKVTTTTGENSELVKNIFRKDLTNYDVVIMTHSCLSNPSAMLELYKYRDSFSGIIIDEAHEVSNLQGSKSAISAFSLVGYYDYALALTATPMKINTSELVNLMYIINRRAVPDLKTCEGILMSDGIQKFKDIIVVRTRKDLGIASVYVPKVHLIKPTKEQMGASGKQLFLTTKGEGAIPQVTELIRIIKEYIPRKGIVYIHQHAIREFVERELDKAGVKYVSAHGKTKRQDLKQICDDFNNNKYSVLLTSLTDSLDLDCDYCVFYEYTVRFKQLIGRAERGLNPKTLYIHYLFTEYTDEPEYFYRNVYTRSLLTQTVLGQDASYIIDAMEMAKKHKSDSTIEKEEEQFIELEVFD